MDLKPPGQSNVRMEGELIYLIQAGENWCIALRLAHPYEKKQKKEESFGAKRGGIQNILFIF